MLLPDERNKGSVTLLENCTWEDCFLDNQPGHALGLQGNRFKESDGGKRNG